MMKEQRFQKNFYVNRDFYDLLVELKKQMDVDANFYVKLKEFLYQNGIYILNKDDSSGKCQCGILNTEDCRQYYHYSCDFGMVKIKNGSQIRIEFDKKYIDLK